MYSVHFHLERWWMMFIMSVCPNSMFLSRVFAQQLWIEKISIRKCSFILLRLRYTLKCNPTFLNLCPIVQPIININYFFFAINYIFLIINYIFFIFNYIFFIVYWGCVSKKVFSTAPYFTYYIINIFIIKDYILLSFLKSHIFSTKQNNSLSKFQKDKKKKSHKYNYEL